MQFLEQQEQLFSLKKQTTELDEQYSRLNLELDRTSLEYRKLIDDLKTRLKSVELQLQYQNVSAPTSGIVFDPRASVEGVISSGDRILSIVPINGLYAEVFVPNQDIGYIQIGQNAKVRIDTFPSVDMENYQVKSFKLVLKHFSLIKPRIFTVIQSKLSYQTHI